MDNYIIALLTFGEGYHNYHHTFSYDYRNGVRWYHFDPTKWLIWTLSKFGLASRLRKNQYYFIEEKMLLEQKQLLLEKIQHFFNDYKEIWTGQIAKLSNSVLIKLRQAEQLRKHYNKLKEKKDEKKEHLQQLRSEIKTIKKDIKKEFRYWIALSRCVTKLSSSPLYHQAAQTIPSDQF